MTTTFKNKKWQYLFNSQSADKGINSFFFLHKSRLIAHGLDL